MLRPLRLADVLVSARLSLPAALLVVAALLKAFDFAVRWSSTVAVLWVLAAAVCALHERWGAASITVLAWWAALFGIYGNHVVWLAWLALTFVIFGDRAQQRLVVRAQLSILYGFGALAKLNPEWLSGEALVAREAAVGWPVVAAWVTMAVEAVLAVALWAPRWRRWWLPVALVAHTAFVLGLEDSTPLRVGLVIFNLTAAGMLVWASGTSTTPRPTGQR